MIAVRWLSAFAMLCAVAVSGCAASMTVTPDVTAPSSADRKLQGRLVYDGKPEYLPRTLAAIPGDIAPVGETLTFRYTFEVAHGGENTSAAGQIFNPLSVVGFPKGNDTIAVKGTLEILRRDQVVKTYTSTSGLKTSRHLWWEGETLTEMRQRGLLAVRDNIEAQMYKERDILTKLSTSD